jgi:uncharacterized protein
VGAARRELRALSGLRAERLLLPACERYAGVVWEHLATRSLPAESRERLGSAVLVVSATHGLLRGDEPCGGDPLHHSDRLPDGRTVGGFWREVLPPVVERLARRADVVWDLLPGDHAATTRLASGPGRYSLRVERRSGGRGQVVSYESKAVKGALARHLLSAEDPTPAGLATFEYRGHVLDPTSPGVAAKGGLVVLAADG